MKIYLIGFMGSGKTTIGKQLSGLLHYGFCDMDEEIAATEGMTVPEIFSVKGESYFRMAEKKMLEDFSGRNNLVVSTGGGAPCFHGNMKIIKSTGISVYISLPPGAIVNRLKNAKIKRPLVADKDDQELLEFIENMLIERERFYLQADIVVNGIDLSASLLKKELEEYQAC